MTKMKHLLVGFGVAVFLGMGACAPDDGPVSPSYATDVKPILDANCVRCHGQGGQLNVDPALTGMLKGKKPASAYLDKLEDPAGCVEAQKKNPNTPCTGALPNAALLSAYLTIDAYLRMPPVPSEALSDRDIGILKRWAAETPAPKP